MNIEEAIKYLKRMRQHFIRADRISTPSLKVSMRVWVEALDVAIEALETQIKQENYEVYKLNALLEYAEGLNEADI